MASFLIENAGYRARVERSNDGMLHGRVIELDECINFRAATVGVITRRFAMALEAYFDRCKQLGVEPEKPQPLGY